MKRFLILCGVLFVIAASLFFKTHTITIAQKKSANDIATDVFAHIKKTCGVLSAESIAERQYINTNIGFSFTYPEHTMVCERRFQNEHGRDEYEITIFGDPHSVADSMPAPVMVIRIDADESVAGQLPSQVVLNTRVRKVGGIDARVEQQKPALCNDHECRVFTIITFSHDGHRFAIEQWEDAPGLLDSFAFLIQKKQI